MRSNGEIKCSRCNQAIIGEAFNWRGHMVHEECFNAYKSQMVADVKEMRHPRITGVTTPQLVRQAENNYWLEGASQ